MSRIVKADLSAMASIILKKHKKIDIAISLLSEAIHLHNEGNNYFASLHLAGASEEIIGKFLKEKDISTSLESEKDAFILVNKTLFGRSITPKYAADFLNRSKNAIKHLDENNPDDEFVILDPKEDAKNMIDRAITNCWRLGVELTKEMEAFWK